MFSTKKKLQLSLVLVPPLYLVLTRYLCCFMICKNYRSNFELNINFNDTFTYKDKETKSPSNK